MLLFLRNLNDLLVKILRKKQLIIKSQNLGISLQPEFISIFKSLKSISFAKGMSHFKHIYLENQMNRKIQELDEKKEIITKAENADNKLIQLKLKLEVLQDNQRDIDDNAVKLLKLHEIRIIKQVESS